MLPTAPDISKLLPAVLPAVEVLVPGPEDILVVLPSELSIEVVLVVRPERSPEEVEVLVVAILVLAVVEPKLVLLRPVVPAVEATPELAPAISVTPKPTPSQPTVDPAVERLRLELQSKNAELEALRQQLAARAPCEHVARPDDAARYQAAIEAQQAAARDAQNAAAPYQDRLLSPPPYSPPI